MPRALELDALTKRYDDGFLALSEFSNRSHPGTPGVVPTVQAAAALSA